LFRVAEPVKPAVIEKEEITKDLVKKEVKTKGEGFMSLSLGTWIMLVIVMIIVAKLAHKLSLKTIFRPTKKSVKKIKADWEES
jgi:hypothetical protein